MMEDYLQTKWSKLKSGSSITEQRTVIALKVRMPASSLSRWSKTSNLSEAAFHHMSVDEGKICVSIQLLHVSFTGEQRA